MSDADSGTGREGAQRFCIDAGASRLRVRTRAAGMLARLAHDLGIVAGELRGEVRLDGAAWTAEITVPVASLRVAGTLRGERLDEGALSRADRAEIERKIRAEVLVAAGEVVVRGKGATRAMGELEVALGARSSRCQVPLDARRDATGAFDVAGRVEISLRALGVAEVKGPLGAFKVSDAVTVLCELRLLPTAC